MMNLKPAKSNYEDNAIAFSFSPLPSAPRRFVILPTLINSSKSLN
ncbi:MAG: hypothetical protein V7L02_06590 [Nostoc sp.]